jgi:hypothetical protein
MTLRELSWFLLFDVVYEFMSLDGASDRIPRNLSMLLPIDELLLSVRGG